MAHPTAEQKQYIDSQWKGQWQGVFQSQNHVVNWLFTINTGGLAGTLAIASKGSGSPWLYLALYAFCAGVMFMAGYAGAMYYGERANFDAFRKNLTTFYAAPDGANAWTDFMAQENKRPDEYLLCVFFAWGAALLAGFGLLSMSFVFFW